MKNTKKIALAAMSLVAAGVAAAGATGTFAWFSVNNKVKVDGMTFSTKVSSNLLVSETNVEANFKSSLNQARNARLEPVSTVSGKTFFYTTDAKADGSKDHDITGDGAVTYAAYSEAAVAEPSNALTNEAAGKTHYDAGFQTTYGVTLTGDNAAKLAAVVYGYVDYGFYLKAMSAETASELVLSAVNLKYNGAVMANANDLAWRAGVFTKKVAAAGTSSIADADLVTILARSGAAYFDDTAVSATNAKAAVTNFSEEAIIDSEILKTEGAQYYFVGVRVWIEGEDTKNYNEVYLDLVENYSLEVRFDLGLAAAVTGATTITSVENILAA